MLAVLLCGKFLREENYCLTFIQDSARMFRKYLNLSGNSEGENGMNAFIMNCSPVRNGATAEIVNIVSCCLKEKYNVKSVCIDDYNFSFCKGCRSCHNTAKCIQHDDVDKIMEQYEWADIIISVAPSYWADIPGQFKAFIDRCTPWCNTHEPHAISSTGCSTVVKERLCHCFKNRSEYERMQSHY